MQEGSIIPNFKLFYSFSSNNNIILLMNADITQKNRIDYPDIILHPCGLLNLDNEARNTHWRKESIFNRGAGQTGWLHVEE